jgi:bifunctional non-homologous end joining protein LigD
MASPSHDALTTYQKKRNFGSTPEPKGRVARKRGRSFVIQKHDASRLHFDFRLELDGVLKSWAVTKGPSLDPSDKRLAVRVEDHPLDYGDFEGTIPQGQYGGGTVMLWDKGEWEPEGDPHEGLRKGKLNFTLKG